MSQDNFTPRPLLRIVIEGRHERKGTGLVAHARLVETQYKHQWLGVSWSAPPGPAAAMIAGSFQVILAYEQDGEELAAGPSFIFFASRRAYPGHTVSGTYPAERSMQLHPTRRFKHFSHSKLELEGMLASLLPTFEEKSMLTDTGLLCFAR